MASSSMRTENMGITVREKPKGSGRWRVFLNRGGRTREIPGFTFKTEQAAEETAEKLRARLSLGLTIQDLSKDAPPLNLYAFNWLDRARGRVKENTWRSAYRGAINHHIVPYFGNKPISEVRPADVRAFLDGLATKGLSPKSITNIRGVLCSIFRSAIEDELVGRSPADVVRVRKPRQSRKKRYNTLDLSELHALLKTIQEHYPKWYAFAVVLAYTGMRLSEMRGLRWGSVHLGPDRASQRRYLVVRETVTGPALVDDFTKTGMDRNVDLNVEARQALLDHHVGELGEGRGRATDYVFCRDDGRSLREGHAAEILTKACALAGLKRVTPLDLRHTYITIMIYELDEDVMYVIDQAGHTSVQMVLKHYGHPERYHRPEKVDKMAPRPATDRPSPATGSVTTQGIRGERITDALHQDARVRE